MPELRQIWREIHSCMNADGNGLCWLYSSASFTGLHCELLYFTLYVTDCNMCRVSNSSSSSAPCCICMTCLDRVHLALFLCLVLTPFPPPELCRITSCGLVLGSADTTASTPACLAKVSLQISR